MKHLSFILLLLSFAACHKRQNILATESIPGYYILTISQIRNGSIGVLHKTEKCTSKSFTENIKYGYKTIKKEDAINNGYFFCNECFTPKEMAFINFHIENSNTPASQSKYFLKRFHNALYEDGVDVGSWGEFRDWFLCPGIEGYKHRKYLYDTLKADGAPLSDTYEIFVDKIGLRAMGNIYFIDGRMLRKVYEELQDNGYLQDYKTFHEAFTGADNYPNRKRVYKLLSSESAEKYGHSYEEFMEFMRAR